MFNTICSSMTGCKFFYALKTVLWKYNEPYLHYIPAAIKHMQMLYWHAWKHSDYSLGKNCICKVELKGLDS